MDYQTGNSWKPLERATGGHMPGEIIEHVMKQYGKSRAEAEAMIAEYDSGSEFWINDLYQVQLRRLDGGLVHLNIRRRDGKAIFRDWRHFQWIKNQLVGPECEAVELYPAESRLVDESNKYHLWCIADPAFRFPIGWEDRAVDYTRREATANGMKQRPL